MPTVAHPSSPIDPPARPGRRWRGFGALVMLGVLTVLVLLWNFGLVALRPLVQAVVQHRSGRTIDFSALHIGLDGAFGPRIAFEGLTIQNAAWAESREPMVRGARVVFEFDWEGLRTGVWLIKRLVLEDADIDLERRADGQRNSRLWNPSGEGPARTRVLRVDAQRSHLRYHDAVTGLRLDIRSAPLTTTRALVGHPNQLLTRRLTFEGVRGGLAFSGSADVGDVVSLQRSGTPFALDGEARSAGLVLHARGLATDLLALGSFDTDLALDVLPQTAPRAAPLSWLPAPLQASLQGHLSHDAEQWELTTLRLHSPHTEAEGRLSWQQPASAATPASVHARVEASRLDAGEFRPTPSARAAAESASAPDTRQARAVDGVLDLHVGQLLWAGTVVAREAQLQARLAQGRLAVDLTGVAIAEGRASGAWRADTGHAPFESTLDLRLAGLRIDRLPLLAPRRQLPPGRLDARAALRAHGRTTAELAESSSGTLQASLAGASVSQRLEAEIGLDGFGFLRSLVGGSQRVPVRCAEIAMALERGRGTIRRLTLETPRTALAGSGSVDLASGQLDVLLSPSSNVGSWLAAPRDIHVRGTFKAPKWSLQAREKATLPQRCVAG